MIKIDNIFDRIPQELPKELFVDILRTKSLRIERIVSDNHSSPEGFWYNQEEDEWVLLLTGSAGLKFKEINDIVVLKPGDYVHISAHTLHRVEWTDSKQKTVWIAVYYRTE